MKFTRLHSIIIISLVLLSLAGLSFIQLNWLKGAMTIREEKIQEQTNLVMERLKVSLDLKLANPAYLYAGSSNQLASKTQEIINITRHTLDSILEQENMMMPYEFGFTSCKSQQYHWFSKPERQNEIMHGCRMQLSNCDFYNPAGNLDHLHFYAIFPQKEQLIFRQLSTAIGSSILFILLLVFAFAYMLSTIYRQKKLSAMKNDFINNLTHEFKTPIASIALAAKTMKRLDPVNESPKAVNYLNLIDQEGKRLENHIDKVLQMATIDSGNFVLDRQSVQVQEVLQRVTSSLQMMLEKKQGQIELSLPPQTIYIYVDPMHFFNIVYNLVDNAIKYNQDHPIIKLKGYRTAQGFQLSVSDNGIGMSREAQKQVFDRFFRNQEGDIHNIKGFGLGLSYVRRMVEAHGGWVEVESQPNRGSTFHLFFPQEAVNAYV